MVAKLARIVLTIMVLCLVSIPCPANEAASNPVETQAVLRALLSVGNRAIPTSCSCGGNYGQKGRASIKDLLSMQLAYLYKGENRIVGSIQSNGNISKCILIITHTSGEDVSSTEIRFTMKHGQVFMNTLQCVMTP